MQQSYAGFIQSPIEQYAELLEDGSRAQDEEPESGHETAPKRRNPRRLPRMARARVAPRRERDRLSNQVRAFLSVSILMPKLARRLSPNEISISIHGDGIDVFARDSCGSGALQA